jgi:hypothetical protein
MGIDTKAAVNVGAFRTGQSESWGSIGIGAAESSAVKVSQDSGESEPSYGITT